MDNLICKILSDILIAIYQPFLFSVILSFFVLFFYLYAYQASNSGKGWKVAICTWFNTFKDSLFFRKLFLLSFIISLILFRTLLNRNLSLNFISDF